MTSNGNPEPPANPSPDPSQLPADLLAGLKQGAVRLAGETWQERVGKLEKLRRVIEERLPDIQQALLSDLGKPPPESVATEIFSLYAEIAEVRRNLKRWMRPGRVRNTLASWGTRNELHWQPRGVILIISPWNYPFQLGIGPLISAIAAGNSVCLKPSEHSPATSKVLQRVIQETFPPDEVALVQGGPETAQQLTELPFDHVIFTGSTRIGSAVMKAAAANLSTVTLELGGKSPTIITPSFNLKRAAERIVWGKFLNAGQTCVAPDYVLVPKQDEQNLLGELVSGCRTRWPSPGPNEPPADYCRIINQQHHDRLTGLLEEALSEGAELVLGGGGDRAELWLEPTLLRGVPEHCSVLREEIFGPILPVVAYDDLSQAIDFVKAKPSPLALYLFSQDELAIEKVLRETQAGDTVINDVLVHFANPRLPFGGVGQSGQGKLHGRYGFEACSHQRAVMRQGPISPSRWISPPYTPRVQRLIRWFLKLGG